MDLYKADVTFTFRGIVAVKAENDAQAKKMIEEGVGLVIGGRVHTSLPIESEVGWVFDSHPEKLVENVAIDGRVTPTL